ncbi:MAG: hypothetical protein GX799_07895 [Crenarchaeota archaeon]|nr:hypothetical protein [Thermoproteota archaeon]
MQTKSTPLQRSPPRIFSSCGLGGVDLEGAEVLAGLGLTGRQAKVYLALLRVGQTRARALAGLALVNRQEIYRVLEELKQLGLASQHLTVPISYAATPIQDAVKLLVDQKSSELCLISKKAAKIAKKLSQPHHPTQQNDDPKPSFGVIYAGEHGKKYQDAIQKTQRIIQATTSWIRFRQSFFSFEDQFNDALKRDIIIHILTEKPKNHHLPKWVKAALERNSNFKLKTTPNPPASVITIFDQKTIALSFSANTPIRYGPDLWTTHPAIIIPCQTYFDMQWRENKQRLDCYMVDRLFVGRAGR